MAVLPGGPWPSAAPSARCPAGVPSRALRRADDKRRGRHQQARRISNFRCAAVPKSPRRQPSARTNELVSGSEVAVHGAAGVHLVERLEEDGEALDESLLRQPFTSEHRIGKGARGEVH